MSATPATTHPTQAALRPMVIKQLQQIHAPARDRQRPVPDEPSGDVSLAC